MNHALFFSPSGELAEPGVYAHIATAAEENGWDGLFLWDHVLRAAPEPPELADPWICLAVAAGVTGRIKLGTMVTPITRRRPIKLAREVVSLDRLSAGRMILGLGLGVDSHGELTKFGEVVDARERGRRLDEGATLLEQLFSGEEVDFTGDYFVAQGVTLRPPPVQRPRVPMWFAARGDAIRPARRAARFDGLFPIDLTADRLRRMLDIVVEERGTLEGFDVAVRPVAELGYEELAAAGATWMLSSGRPGRSLDDVLATAMAGPEATFEAVS